MTKTLPKWPCILVHGESVTPEQAAEIIIRTDPWWFSSNNAEVEGRYRIRAGLAAKRGYGSEDLARQTAQELRFRVLPLEYLNNEQIMSTWVHGVHGWCHWDGTISAGSFNIGKWPSIAEVYAEWTIIAEAFPFLNLTCQLLDCESCEIGDEVVVAYDESGTAVYGRLGSVIVEFRVKDGRVEMVEPSERLPIHEPVVNLFEHEFAPFEKVDYGFSVVERKFQDG